MSEIDSLDRPKHKDVEIGGRLFRIKKFTAQTGCYVIFKVMSLVVPILNGARDGQEAAAGDFSFAKALAGLSSLSEKDFSDIQTKCLQVCFENLPGGFIPVLNDNGDFGVMGLEEETAMVMALTVHALIFNTVGFFAVSPLASLLGGLSSTNRPDA